MWREFKEFMSRGNVFDLAVAVMIGAAFGKIVESLVQDMMVPFLGILFGGVNFAGLSYPIGEEVVRYGAFLQTLFDFFLMAFSIFLMIKIFNKLRRKGKAIEIKPTTNLDVLMEIRDLLKNIPVDDEDYRGGFPPERRRTTIRFKKRD
jgi:large conductance mechanosensitive channel